MAERVRLEQGEPWISYTYGEVRQMVNNKRQHDQSAHDHVSRGERGFYIFPVEVWLRPGTPVFNRQLDGHVSVNDNRDEQENADQPQQRAKVAQVLRVTVNPVRADENLEIAQQMSDNKEDQNDPSDGNDHFLPNRRAIKSR